MSGEKIYPASPRKRKEARDNGQVAKSTDLITVAVLFITLAFINMNKEVVFEIASKIISILMTNIGREFNPTIVNEYIKILLKYVAPLLCVVLAASFMANYFQVGLKASPKALKPDFKKLNPISGFKRMFSKDSIVELVKALLKVVVVLYIAFSEIKKILLQVNGSYSANLPQVFSYIFENLFSAVIKICMFLLALSAADFMYKKYKFEKDLMMTRQEMMDEYKQDEGNPMVKQRQREFARMLTKKQIQKVKEATVLVVNPTHYAVAIKFDRKTHPIPVVLFKGVDEIALAAKKIAAENGIPTIENRPLARGLYAKVNEGDFITEEFFEAVADVISHIMLLDKKNKI